MLQVEIKSKRLLVLHGTSTASNQGSDILTKQYLHEYGV
jgi:hypothetical protein